MRRFLAGLFEARKHKKELEELRWRMHAMIQRIDPLTLVKTGSRIRRELENENYELDLDEEDDAVDKWQLQRIIEAANKHTRTADHLGETEEDIAPVLAFRLLSGWLRCKIIARTSQKKAIVEEALGCEKLFFSYMKNFFMRFAASRWRRNSGKEEITWPDAQHPHLRKFLPISRPSRCGPELNGFANAWMSSRRLMRAR